MKSYDLFTRDDELATLDNRLRQLEGEHYGQRLLLLEAEVLSITDAELDAARANLAQLEARADRLRQHREQLVAEAHASAETPAG